jgi:hypothetical protein
MTCSSSISSSHPVQGAPTQELEPEYREEAVDRQGRLRAGAPTTRGRARVHVEVAKARLGQSRPQSERSSSSHGLFSDHTEPSRRSATGDEPTSSKYRLHRVLADAAAARFRTARHNRYVPGHARCPRIVPRHAGTNLHVPGNGDFSLHCPGTCKMSRMAGAQTWTCGEFESAIKSGSHLEHAITLRIGSVIKYVNIYRPSM